MSTLIIEYLGECKIGGKRWPVRVANFADDVEGDRTA